MNLIRDFTPDLIPWWVRLIIALALIAILIGIGWTFRGWRADRDIAELQRDQAKQEATAAKGALTEFSRASTVVNNAAIDAGHAIEALNTLLGGMNKERKTYVQAHPLPADCRPDAERLRQLEQAVNAANTAISAAGQ